MSAVSLCADLSFVKVKLVQVGCAYVFPLFTLPKDVFSVSFDAVAGVMRALFGISVLGVFKPVWGSYASHEDGLHPP